MPQSASATSAAPAWFDAEVGWDEPLPGLPDFVSLAWIERWHSLTVPGLRRLQVSVTRSRDESPLGAWWPATIPFPSQIPHLLARAMREPAGFADLARHYALAGGVRAGPGRATLFQRLRDAFDEADEAESDALFESHTFVSFLEDPAEATRRFAEMPLGPDGEGFATFLATDPSVASLTGWLRAHFPEAAAEIDRRLPGAASAAPPDAGTPEPAEDTAPAHDVASIPSEPAVEPSPAVAEEPQAAPQEAATRAVAPQDTAPPETVPPEAAFTPEAAAELGDTALAAVTSRVLI